MKLLLLLLIISLIFVYYKSYLSENFEVNKINQGYIDYPSGTKVLRYNGCYTNQQIPRNISVTKTSCSPYTDKNTVEGKMNNVTVTFMSTSSNDINDIKSSTIPFFVPHVYMKDPEYRNIVNYTNEIPADVDQIGSIPVNDYDKEPDPINDI